MNYLIAIPSYKRAEALRDKTLALLQKHQIDSNRILVFVANDEEYKIYEKVLIKGTYGSLNVGVVGMRAIRNYIQDFFDEGQYIVNMDDDIKGLKVRLNDYDCKDLEDLDDLIKKGFEVCEKVKASLWGIYPLVNAKFMYPKPSLDLRLIAGVFWGLINTHDKETYTTLTEKEDYERTIKFYIRDGKVVRFNHVGIETNYYSNEGGIGALWERTYEKSKEAGLYLIQKYPMFCSYNKARKNHFEILLKDKRLRKKKK